MKLIVRGIKAGVINLITVTSFFFFFNNLASIVAWSYIISHLKEYYFENEDYFYDVFQPFKGQRSGKVKEIYKIFIKTY